MKAVCLLSGGLDSATCLAYARREGFECHALSFDYGQRHRIELDAARQVAAALSQAASGSSCGEDRSAHLWPLRSDPARSRSRRDADETSMPHGIPITYVPARNTIFLSFALKSARAGVRKRDDIYIGVDDKG